MTPREANDHSHSNSLPLEVKAYGCTPAALPKLICREPDIFRFRVAEQSHRVSKRDSVVPPYTVHSEMHVERFRIHS